MRSKWRRKNERGFLLFEVLVATAVLGLGLTAVVRAFGGSLQGVRRVEERGALRLRLEDKLEEVWREGVRGAGSAEGEFAGGVRWRTATRPYEGLDGLYLVDVYVVAADGASETAGQIVVPGR